MKQNLTPKYGLLTTISLVIGCVIGSGIFFKVDDILKAANGNSLAGLIGWITVGISVVLGAIALAYYARLLPTEGGLISYTSYRLGRKPSFLVGWFYMTIYYPILGAVLFTVAGIYTANLFANFYEYTPTFNHYSIIGFIYLILLYLLNLKKPSLGGLFQSVSTVLKIIPLLLIAALGITMLISGNIPAENTLSYSLKNTSTSNLINGSLATFIPIAFAFDGWYVATQISGEVKNAKRNLPIALIAGTLIVMLIYIFYYLGIVYNLGGQQIISYQDSYISKFAKNISGNTGAVLMQIAIITSVLGAANAVLIGGLRVPFQLVNSGVSKNFFNVNKLNTTSYMPINSAKFMLALIIIALVLFNVTSTLNFFIKLKFDLSSLPVTFVYVINLCLYIGLFKLINNNTLIGNKLSKYIISIIAIFGALIVLIGGIISSNGILYIICSITVLLIGLGFYKKEE